MTEQDFTIFGKQNAPLIFYFHGAPGSVADGKWFDEIANSSDFAICAINYLGFDGQYIEKSAQIIKNKSQNKKPIIIGFSIGAMVAIKVQKALNNIANLYLISPAMPLNDYKIAKQMAGFVVFDNAKNNKILFDILISISSIIAKIAPKFLINSLFASAPEIEKELFAKPDFVQNQISAMKNAFINHPASYKKLIIEYANWNGRELSGINIKEIHQGNIDNWAPIELLKSAMPNQTLTIHDKKGHYSTLFAAIAKILNPTI